MKYCISIDWLAFFCTCLRGGWEEANLCDQTITSALPYRYEIQSYGTRHFKHLVHVYYLKEKICEVQYESCSPAVIAENAIIVKFENRLLYQPELWDIVEKFVADHYLIINNISRIDICADFNEFKDYNCVNFIADFLASRLRHKGRGLGNAHFNHYSKKRDGVSIAHLDYTGLSFGSHASDSRAYLYDKTFELLCEKDKPYIKDFWRVAGLDLTRHIWRLEISLKSGAMKFKDKVTGQQVEIVKDSTKDTAELLKIYHTFVRKLFSFVKNRPNITNISREPVIELFDGSPFYFHRVIRNVTGSTRTERILIKQLWQMADRYRAMDDDETEGVAKGLAVDLARGSDLEDWFIKKRLRWEKPHRK